MAQIIKKNNLEENIDKKKENENFQEKENENTDVQTEKQVETLESKEESIAEYEKQEIANLKAENQKKDDQIRELSLAMEKMQAQMEAFMKGAMANAKASSKEDSEDVLVGCRGIYGGVLSTSDDSLSFKFECDEEKYINSDDLKLLFRDSKRGNKTNFEKDLFYFVDASNYDKFKIKKRVDLSPENIARILSLPAYDMIDAFNALTNNKNHFWTVLDFQYQVVKMMVKKDSRLANWSYENRHELEKYIGQKFDYLLASVGAVELLGRKKYNE